MFHSIIDERKVYRVAWSELTIYNNFSPSSTSYNFFIALHIFSLFINFFFSYFPFFLSRFFYVCLFSFFADAVTNASQFTYIQHIIIKNVYNFLFSMSSLCFIFSVGNCQERLKCASFYFLGCRVIFRFHANCCIHIKCCVVNKSGDSKNSSK